MTEQEESGDLLQLVPNEEETRLVSNTDDDINLPPSPGICKITPASPTSNNVSSSGANSVQGSRNLSRIGQSMTPVSGANTKFLYVSEKFSSSSRRPSLLSDLGCRTPKEIKQPTARIKEFKKEVETSPSSLRVVNTWKDAQPTRVPPNTPSPSDQMKSIVDRKTEEQTLQVQAGSLRSSGDSSQMTTMALASESEDITESDSSTQTLKKSLNDKFNEKYKRNFLPLDRKFKDSYSSSSGNFENLNQLEINKLNYPNFKNTASKNFLKSYWNQKIYQRQVQHHCFLSDVTDVRKMEEALLHLLEDFHSGKLRAFAKDCSMDQMQGIREQQERLAKMHFDFGAQQELYAPLSDEGLRVNQDNMKKLFTSLEQLSVSIERLHSFSRDSSHE